jgi:hypothetical protein
VPSFDLDTNLAEDRAFQLARNSVVTLFWRREVLAETVTWLAEHGYQLVRLDAGGWTTSADFHHDVKAALDFPDYYGHNLDAFNDCMRDVATYEYGATRDATGTVLVFTGYDAFAAREPRAAQVILDVIADAARRAMLVGHRMLCLAQSNDADIAFEPVGATPVLWNPAERQDALRR